uniref:Uncharacterized protein n=1 Tax=Phlebotomus papatasi TaxID=29031 RepID=A0A1B0DG25_PHLPP
MSFSQSFSENNKKAVDEIWYKRAVEQHFVEPTSFTYSVPFDAAETIENTKDVLVTASHAIFHTDGGKSAPAAVVGFQFQHSALKTLFRNITANCGDASCSKTCASDGDRNLMQSLVYDAKVTSWWNATHNLKDDKGNEFKQRFGITVAFMATHSGLTRWQEFYSNSVEEIRSEPFPPWLTHILQHILQLILRTAVGMTKIANLLGVAGTDVPIKDIKRLMMPFMLGVNGYAFIVTNNGYVLIHPDLRPVFQDILKPAYNAVDMIEVELMDDDRDPRDFNENLIENQDQTTDTEKYHFMTTVSMPVFDRRENAPKSLAEVREQVLNYIPVMARPLVLNKTYHPIIWTQVYADEVDPKMTDWQWEIKEREEQKERFMSQRKNYKNFHLPEEQERRYQLKLKKVSFKSNSLTIIVNLVDISGSMTGQRNDIAKHVVNNILDTLGTNDFVNIFKFAISVEEIVPCFRDMLVQANMENIRQLKMAMEDFQTEEIANVTAALIRAFELLEEYRNDKVGARCNQAIMLISDGVPYKYQDIFEYYNWPYIPVRIFTYLIGREVADVKEIKWMASVEVISAIEWSEKLDNIFRDNYDKDPTLSWQFF